VKLYYEDPYIHTFSAKIEKVTTDERGRTYVVLNKTAFYPTGGGQPHDVGTLNGVYVVEVVEEDGEVRHYVERPIDEHAECIGKIDWTRRFDHMQQHAGQHILSAAFDNTFGYKTVSFHLGEETCTIDLQIDQLHEEEAKKAEEIANQIILENRPIETKWVTEDELSQYTLRKALAVTDNIRLVIIPDFDYNGCGGTHPRSTGEVSMIKILHWEKQKKNTIRITFVCGNRVRKQLQEKHQVIQGLTGLLNSPQEKMIDAASSLLERTKELEKTVNELTLQLLEYEGKELLARGEIHGDQKIVKAIFQNRAMSELQQLAKLITTKADSTIVLFINETGAKLQFICSRSMDEERNMNHLVKEVLPLINGKGGGSDHTAQGGGDKVIQAGKLMKHFLDKLNKMES
jgi:alanyl-tRNA synthetase